MADDKKSPKDTPHIIIEAEATTTDGDSNGGASDGNGASKPREKTPKKNKAGVKNFGRGMVRFFGKIFVAITFVLAVYAIFDNWQVKRDLAQVQRSVETLKLAGDEFARQNLTSADQESIARLLQAINGFGEQIDALNTRLFSMEAEIEGLQKPPATALAIPATPATPTTPATPATPATPPAPVAPSNFSIRTTPKPPLLPLIQAAQGDASFDQVLADYLPHYPTAHALNQWAATPPPSLTSLWRKYDGLLALTLAQQTGDAGDADNTEASPGWFGRLIALANTSIRITPLDEAVRFDALKKASTSRDLPTAMLAVADYIAQNDQNAGNTDSTPNTSAPSIGQWQAWLTQADQRLQLDAALTTLLNTNALPGRP